MTKEELLAALTETPWVSVMDYLANEDEASVEDDLTADNSMTEEDLLAALTETPWVSVKAYLDDED